MKKGTLLTSLLLMSSLVSVQASAISPSEVLIKIYSVAVSTNADCSNPVVVIDNGSTPKEVDFISVPKLGNASVANGTYPCVILKMSDVIKFRPATSSGPCAAGTQYTIDVCRANSSTYTPMTISGASATYGTSIACTGTDTAPTDDQVPLFISTQSTNVGGGNGSSAFDRPAVAGANGFNLTNSFVVTGSGSGTFIVNFNDKIDTSQSACGLNPPIFGFR